MILRINLLLQTTVLFAFVFTQTGCGKLWGGLSRAPSSGISCNSSSISSTYGGGAGTSSDPYLICSAEQMNLIGTRTSDWSKSFKLTSDIDLSAYTGTQYNIIGNAGTQFTGTFDGNNKTISNFTFTNAAIDNVGLFGYISNATISNLNISNANVTGKNGVGALVGSVLILNNATISNITVDTAAVSGTGGVGALGGSIGALGLGATINNSSSSNCTVTVSNGGAGGLAGSAYSINNSWSSCTVTDTGVSNSDGGLVGSVKNISNSYATGNVIAGNSSSVGGLAGSCSGTLVDSSYSTGTATGNSQVGGLIGTVSSSLQVNNSYSTSNVTANTTYAGGLIGAMNGVGGLPAGIHNSYARGSVTATTNTAGGLVGWVTVCTAEIVNSYSSGLVNAGASKGGLIGMDVNGGTTWNTYTASYWDITVNAGLQGIGTVGGAVPAGVVSANTAAMQNTATFIGAGWTTTYWNLSTVGQYLKLIWQP